MGLLNLIHFYANNEEFERLVKKSELKLIIFLCIKKEIAKQTCFLLGDISMFNTIVFY